MSIEFFTQLQGYFDTSYVAVTDKIGYIMTMHFSFSHLPTVFVCIFSLHHLPSIRLLKWMM